MASRVRHPVTQFSRRYRVQILTLVFGSLAVWVCWSWALTFERVVRNYCPLPTWDYWRIPYDAFFYKVRGIQSFFEPHNEHRIIFPEIVFQLDLLLHGRLIVPIVFSFACYAASWLVLAWIFCRDHTIGVLSRLFAVLLSGIIFGWQGSAIVIADPFLLQWTLSTLCAISSIVLLERARSVVLPMIAAVVATYSSGNCLLLWPVLLLECWILRLPRRRITAVAVIGAVAIAAYFIDYHATGNVHSKDLVLHPLFAAGFFATYMAMPFGLGKSDTVAICLGLANILVAAVLFLYARRKHVRVSGTLLFLFCIYLFTLLTDVLTTAGRINWAGGYGEAKANRYWIIHLVNWGVLALICVYLNARAHTKPKTKIAIAVLLAGAAAYGTLKVRSSLSYDDNQFANRQLAALGFEAGIEDTGLARRIFPDANFVLSLTPFLREHHLSVYSLPDFNLLGRPARVVGKIIDEPRAGGVSLTLPVIGGIEFVGWAEPERNGVEKIIFLNQTGDIAGFGKRLPAGFPFDLRSLLTPTMEAWVGFVNLRYSGEAVRPFFLTHGRLEPIDQAIPIRNDLERVRGDGKTPLAGVEWQMDSAWTKNGVPKIAFPSNLPRGAIYGSWSGDDRNTGKIVSAPFSTPANRCLVLPVEHGLIVQGLSVAFANADTGQVVRTIPMQNGDSGWQFWKVRFDQPVSRLRILAQDQGAGSGEWIAIAEPSQCDDAGR